MVEVETISFNWKCDKNYILTFGQTANTQSFLTVPHLSLFGMPFLALLLPSLISGPDLGAWPDCWVSVEFPLALTTQKWSGSTTTTLNVELIFSKVLKPSFDH